MNDATWMQNWSGATITNQADADRRIPELLQKAPTARLFLILDPLLGPIDLEMALEDFQPFNPDMSRKPAPIQWVIIGGESGPRARPCNVDWIRSIVRQCAKAGVPCFVKQLGSMPVDRNDRGYEGDGGPIGWPMDTDTIDDVEPGVYQGKPVRIRTKHPKGGDPSEWPEDLRVRQFPWGGGK